MLKKSAVEFAVRRYYRDIFIYCFSELQEKADALDVTQEVFLFLLERREQLEDTHLRAWLYQVAQKKVQEKRRANVRFRQINRRLDHAGIDPETDPQKLLELQEEISEYHTIAQFRSRILRMLTPQERDLFDEVYIRHIKQTDLAKRYGISEQALYMRTCRLRSKIRELVKTMLALGLVIWVKTH